MNKIFTCCMVLAIAATVKAQSFFTERLTTTYGASTIYSLSPTTDKTIVISGDARITQPANPEAYIGELSNTGSLLWNKTFILNNDRGATSAIQTADGGYAMLTANGFLVKLRSDHSTQFISKLIFQYSFYILARAFVQTADGGYVITGSDGARKGAPGNRLFIAKLDSAGNFVWYRYILSYGTGNAISKTKNGGFVIGGISYVNDADGDMCIVNTDSLGNVIFSAVVGGSKSEAAHDVIQTSDNGFLLAGETYSFAGTDKIGAYIAKFNTTGNLEWTKTLKTNGYIRSWRILPDRLKTHTIVSQAYISDNANSAYEQLINISDNGKVNRAVTTFIDSNVSFTYQAVCRGANRSVWSATTGYGSGSSAFLISKSDSGGRNCSIATLDITQQAGDGTSVLINQGAIAYPAGVRIATPLNTGAGGTTIMVQCEEKETKSQSVSTAIHQLPVSVNRMAVYPNPASAIIHISGLHSSAVSRLSVTDITGKVLATAKVSNSFYNWNIEKLSRGVYYIRIQSGNEVNTLTFAKQ